MSIWHDLLLDRDVAVKCFSNKHAIRTEIEALAKIHSKHVVDVYDICVDSQKEGDACLVMEYVAGADIGPRSDLKVEEFLKVLYQVAQGLEDIHLSGCIHRDIKPENIRVGKDRIVKIVDFGLSSRAIPTITKIGRGTVGFRGPEYFLQPKIVTCASDIYAFGATAFCLGFGGLTADMEAIPPNMAPSFSKVRLSGESLHLELVEIFNRCLDHDPLRRPLAGEIARLLARHLLIDAHIGKLLYGGVEYVIDKNNPIINVRGRFKIFYDGMQFILRSVSVDLFVNNVPAKDQSVLPGGCVITLGQGSRGNRTFIPFSISNPEVVL